MTTKKTINLTILIDGITTPKLNIISLTYRKKLIDQTPFQLKQPIPGHYNYRHHFNKETLDILTNTYPTLFSYEDRKEKTGQDLTPDSWEKTIKYNLYRLISDGTLNRMIEQEDKIINLQIIWKGDEIHQPTGLKTPPEKKPKEEKIDLTGLTLTL